MGKGRSWESNGDVTPLVQKLTPFVTKRDFVSYLRDRNAKRDPVRVALRIIQVFLA